MHASLGARHEHWDFAYGREPADQFDGDQYMFGQPGYASRQPGYPGGSAATCENPRLVSAPNERRNAFTA